ncbi:unnamed protein product [Hydatigera taeniaeformis]|uniref:MFS domain-containing protein n=1 Tax=Hydatigena taeniaeformis TaxID=6205 RepID=A0A0R3X0S2_HYDTA|nr:unnamed protein product [Hydatigera taeniaeformis]
MAANDSLCTIVVIEFLGLSRLVSGLGFCLFCQGVASIFGPPVIELEADPLPEYIAYIAGVSKASGGLLPLRGQAIRRSKVMQTLNGFIIDATESYTVAFTVGGAGVLLAGLVMLPAIFRQLQHRRAKRRRLEARRRAAAAVGRTENGDVLICSSPLSI